MDIFSTSVEVIHEVYAITIFIKEVVADIRTYGSQTQSIQDKLNHEFVFIETFKDLCFDREKNAFMKQDLLSSNLKQDVHMILQSLNETLAGYGKKAIEHGILLDQKENTNKNPIGQQQADPSTVLSKKCSGNPQQDTSSPARTLFSHDRAKRSKGLKDRIEAKVEALKVKARPLEWSLFSKEKINAVLQDYSEWTNRLRQDLELMLLVGGVPGQGFGFGPDEEAAKLGIEAVLRRQRKAGKAPPSDRLKPLEGQLLQKQDALLGSSLTVDEYSDPESLEESKVLVEVRKYSPSLEQAIEDRDDARASQLKRPVAILSWLLSGKGVHKVKGTHDTVKDDFAMHVLDCIGYLDEPSNNRSLLLYQLPVSVEGASPPQTLHPFIDISRDANNKPALENRFHLARALASTVLGIMTSGWVHKNISARSVLIISDPTYYGRVIPYLIGWGLARESNMGSNLKGSDDLEENMYYHPRRSGRTVEYFQAGFDIYSLGVVLLEIGLWTTMPHLFRKQLDHFEANKRNGIIKFPRSTFFQEKSLELARSKAMAQEMGSAYASTVERCLQDDFDTGDSIDSKAEIVLKFRESVVDVLRRLSETCS